MLMKLTPGQDGRYDYNLKIDSLFFPGTNLINILGTY